MCSGYFFRKQSIDLFQTAIIARVNSNKLKVFPELELK